MRVGFIGLGVQGKGLAVNALRAGFPLSVFDRDSARCNELAAQGAAVATSNADLAARSRLIQVCVLDDAQLTAVFEGPAGLLDGLRPGTLVAVHSTVRPDTVARLAEAAAARDAGLIDAPVSGGAAGAQARRMSFMVGGEAAALDSCRAVFEASGSRIVHCGPLGSGLKAKLAHQVIVAMNLMAAYEGMRLGTRLGLAPAMLEEVVSDGAAQSRVADHWHQLYLGPQAPAVFHKDLTLCLEVGASLGLALPGAVLCRQLLNTILAEHLVPAAVA